MKRLWDALNPEEKLEACQAVWTSKNVPGGVASDITAELARLMRFRPMQLLKQPPAVLAGWLVSRVQTPGFRTHLRGLLMAWLVGPRKAVLEAFLNSMSVPHTDGFLADEATPPTTEAFTKGVRTLRQEHGDRVTAIYLGFLLSDSGDAFWSALPAALASEGFDPAAIM
ncbi:MAG: hypothetical protein U1F77_19565 [Kiritimatiellia bacterium]